jgi:hypothetical protein
MFDNKEYSKYWVVIDWLAMTWKEFDERERNHSVMQ